MKKAITIIVYILVVALLVALVVFVYQKAFGTESGDPPKEESPGEELPGEDLPEDVEVVIYSSEPDVPLEWHFYDGSTLEEIDPSELAAGEEVRFNIFSTDDAYRVSSVKYFYEPYWDWVDAFYSMHSGAYILTIQNPMRFKIEVLPAG